MLFNRKLKRRSTVIVGVIAGLSFLALAIYGWGVPAAEVASFLVICIAFLALILISAGAIGFILILIRKAKKDHSQ
ncbi:hypothetical protein [Halioxenophilus aromaticivorans]|uniref:Uncharacterized protein n=1 Tax=Halioxenophilus aromaticivorans TaxID=1306992 RepID=A0AAV3TX18_9ALTE